ncbi:MAG TPA: hypothetical protein VFD37_01710 [Solirubrobacterales bacterium]|nr:hypothetical protein [Solirubrobacterales bacterium]
MPLSVPNFSEGRDPARIAAIRATLSEGATVLDRHSDRDHHRTVFTVYGPPETLGRALVDAADLAARSIDMHRHRGLHPCIGALDVCPIVWHRPEDRGEAIDLAYSVAEQIGALQIPAFLYGDLATTDQRRERAYFREGGLPALERRMSDGELRPDRGPDRPHSRAGATLITARPPLAAFNVELDTADPGIAKQVAAQLRESAPGGEGLPGVRAIGLYLGASGRAQVSTNVHDPFAVPLAVVTQRIAELAAAHGARPVAAEIVGLVPAAALEGYPDDPPIHNRDDRRQTIEGVLASSE